MGKYNIVWKYFLSKIQKVPNTNEKTDISDYIKIETSVNKTPKNNFFKKATICKKIFVTLAHPKHMLEKNTNYSVEKQQRHE